MAQFNFPSSPSTNQTYVANGVTYKWDGVAWRRITTTGAQGNTGAQGTAGAQGAQGHQGATGSGAQGATGPTGAQGHQGNTGGGGSTGAQGATGATGAQGATGSTGAQGATGPTGAQGAQGHQGNTGSTGAQGDAGSRSYTVTNSGSGAYVIDGTNNPTLNLLRGFTYTFNINASGHPFYIKTAQTTGTGNQYTSGVTGNGTQSGTLTFAVPYNAPSTLYYICQYHGAMSGIINISDVGPTGAQGAIGNTGAQGATGSGGSTGAQGAQGHQGNTGGGGSTGAQGATGATGAQGATGSGGSTGSTGAQGATGATGAQGATGSGGSTGAQGATGATGAQGAANTGAQGATGSTGAQGATGSGGSTGAQGASGPATVPQVKSASNTSEQYYFSGTSWHTRVTLTLNSVDNNSHVMLMWRGQIFVGGNGTSTIRINGGSLNFGDTAVTHNNSSWLSAQDIVVDTGSGTSRTYTIDFRRNSGSYGIVRNVYLFAMEMKPN